jgi:hypothetical protein
MHHNHHHLHQQQQQQQLSPDASPPSGNHLWPMYNNNSSSNANLYNKCIMGLNQLRLVEFSGFLEKRRDPEIYHKHLFVHLNTADLLGSGVTMSPGGGTVSTSTVPSSTSSSTNINNTSNTSNSESLIDDFEVS